MCSMIDSIFISSADAHQNMVTNMRYDHILKWFHNSATLTHNRHLYVFKLILLSPRLKIKLKLDSTNKGISTLFYIFLCTATVYH